MKPFPRTAILRARCFLWMVWLAGCGENSGSMAHVVCEGSTLAPTTECGEGYCVNGDACEPIFEECGSSEVPILGGGCWRVGLPEDCWDGWVPDGDDGCEPILPKGECPTGTMPVIGQSECQPVGVPQDCWPGWVNDGDGGCEPILPAGDCPDGTMPIIGQATCQPIGDCNAPPPTGPDVRVVDATLGPYATIQAAIDDANPGDTVYVAAGEYLEDVSVGIPLRIEGKCAAEVTIRGTGAATFAIIVSGSGPGSFTLRGITVTGAAAGIRVQDRSVAVIEDVVVRDCEGIGIGIRDGASGDISRALVVGNRFLGVAVYAATAALDQVVVRDTRARSDALFGYGLDVEGASDVTVRRSLVSGNRAMGIFVWGATAIFDEVVVRETRQQQADGLFGRGISVLETSNATLRRSMVSDNRDVGLRVHGSTALVEDVVVRGTIPLADGTYGRGIEVVEASRATVRRSLVSGNREEGLLVSGSTAAVEEVVVRDTQPREADDLAGRGIGVEDASEVTVRRSLVSGNHDVGLVVSGSTAAVEEVVVRDTVSSNGLFGRGIEIDETSEATLRRSLVSGNPELGLFVSGSTATVEEVFLRGLDAVYCRGIDIQEASGVTVRRSLVSGNREMSLFVGSGSTVLIEEVVARGVLEAPDESGRGINIQGASEAMVRRSLVAGSGEMGVFVGSDSTATVDEVVVRDTAAAGDGRFGDGVVVGGPDAEATEASLHALLVENSAQVGVYFYEAGGDLAGSVIRGNTHAVVLEEEADLTMSDDNLFEDNPDCNEVCPGGGRFPAPEPVEEILISSGP